MHDDFYDDELKEKFMKLLEKFAKTNDINNMIKDLFNNSDFIEGLQNNNKINIGFSIFGDPNGNLDIKPFYPDTVSSENNFLFNKEKISNSHDDLYFETIHENEKEIIIIGDVSGFTKDDITVGSKKNKIVINCTNDKRHYKKEIDLQAFDESSVSIKLKNGLLEIKLELLNPIEQEKNYKVNIE